MSSTSCVTNSVAAAATARRSCSANNDLGRKTLTILFHSQRWSSERHLFAAPNLCVTATYDAAATAADAVAAATVVV